MHKRHRCGRHGVVVGAFVALVSLLGLTGCYRGGWNDPERIEKRTNSIIEDVKDDLDLRADQEPAFDALAGKIRAHVVQRSQEHRGLAVNLKTEFEAKPVNSERVAALLKEHLARQTDRSAEQAIVDDAAAFYRTLDAKQQETVNKKVRRLLDWHF